MISTSLRITLPFIRSASISIKKIFNSIRAKVFVVNNEELVIKDEESADVWENTALSYTRYYELLRTCSFPEEEESLAIKDLGILLLNRKLIGRSPSWLEPSSRLDLDPAYSVVWNFINVFQLKYRKKRSQDEEEGEGIGWGERDSPPPLVHLTSRLE